MLEVFNLSGNLPSFQMGFATSSFLHQVVDLGIQNSELATRFFQLVGDGAMTLDLGQGTPVIQPCDLFMEHMMLQHGPHEQGSEPSWQWLGWFLNVIGRREVEVRDVGSFASSLMLTESSHTSVVELTDPFGKDCGFIGARYVKGGGSSRIGLVPIWAIGIGDLVMFNASFQHLDLPPELDCLLSVGLLNLADSADSSTQYSPESGGIEGWYVLEEIVQ